MILSILDKFNEYKKINVVGIDSDPDRPNPERHSADSDPAKYADLTRSGSGSITLALPIKQLLESFNDELRYE
jgi:hypothetical protein